jgi:putative spermidine/putrescine transport system permease protein
MTTRRELGWEFLILPALLLLTTIFFLPIAYLAVNSFHPYTGMGTFGDDWTVQNYVRFLTDSFYLGLLLDTFKTGFIVVTICMVISYPVAYFLARTHSRWRGALIFITISPLLITVVIRNLGWLPVLGASGMVNRILMGLGIITEPFQLISNHTAVIVGLVHALSPFMILSLMTVIQRIEPEIEEASINLGATPFETFCRVILPLSRPGLLGGYLLVFTVVLSAFTTPAMMGGNRVLLMAPYIAQQMGAELNYPVGAMAAVVLMAVTSGMTLLALRLPGQGSASGEHDGG